MTKSKHDTVEPRNASGLFFFFLKIFVLCRSCGGAIPYLIAAVEG